MDRAQSLIAQSVSHTEIVTVGWDYAVAMELQTACDDHVEANGRTEYWGTKDGQEWRIHLTGVEATDKEIRALRREAGEAGDVEQVTLCDAALAGDLEARAKCDAAIQGARAQC